DRMARLKIVSRRGDPTDGRRALVQLTREGERRLQRLSIKHLEGMRGGGPPPTKMLKWFRQGGTGVLPPSPPSRANSIFLVRSVRRAWPAGNMPTCAIGPSTVFRASPIRLRCCRISRGGCPL